MRGTKRLQIVRQSIAWSEQYVSICLVSIQASLEVTLPELKAAVAAAGMTCDSVVDGATEAAL